MTLTLTSEPAYGRLMVGEATDAWEMHKLSLKVRSRQSLHNM